MVLCPTKPLSLRQDNTVLSSAESGNHSYLLEEMKHFCRMVTAIGKTIEIQRLIDDVYPEAEKDVIEFKTQNTMER